MPGSHCGELGLRVYYEYWRVITRQKIRELAEFFMRATRVRHLREFSSTLVRDVYY